MDPYADQDRIIVSPLDKEPFETTNEKTMETNKDAETKSDDGETVVEHLENLRKQLIKSAFVFIFFMIIVFSTINWWFPYITKGHTLIVLGPLEVIKFYTSISVTLSLGLSLPFLIHFLWQFVKPGLNPKEAHFLGLYSPAMFLLFIAGLTFGYMIVNPLSYQFLIKLGAMNFDVMVTAQEYVHFLIMTTIPLGLLFELPIVVMFLSSIEVLTAETMVRMRKWSYIVIAVISALITPPDFISQLIVLVPMALLYDGSIYIVRRMERRKKLYQVNRAH